MVTTVNGFMFSYTRSCCFSNFVCKLICSWQQWGWKYGGWWEVTPFALCDGSICRNSWMCRGMLCVQCMILPLCSLHPCISLILQCVLHSVM